MNKTEAKIEETQSKTDMSHTNVNPKKRSEPVTPIFCELPYMRVQKKSAIDKVI